MLRIREATIDDNAALLDLERESPQGTGIAILVDREDYFYRSRVHEQSKVLIAEEDGRLVGVMAYAIKQACLNSTPDRVAYFYDLRGEVTYRRSMKRGLFRLWREILSDIESQDPAFIYGHVKADNLASLNVSSRMGAQVAADFDILTLPSLAGRATPLDPHLDALDAEIERIEQRVGPRDLRLCDFGAPYRRGRELGFLKGIFRLADGRSSAQVSAWDLSSIYRGRVVRMPLSLTALGWVLNPLAHVLPTPRVPRTGESIRYLQLFDPICEGPNGRDLLKQLLQQLRRNAHHDGIDILTLFAYRDDPLVQIPRFFPEKRLHYFTIVRPCRSEELPRRPLYLDIRDI